MKKLFVPQQTFRASRILCFSAVALILSQAQGRAAVVTQVATDPGGTYTFNNGNNFSPATPPTAGNTYVDPSFTMRTADVTTGTTTSTGVPYAFAGDSLTVGNGTATFNGASLAANVLYKGSVTGLTVTINNFIASGGEFTNGAGNGNIAVTLGGAVTIQSGGLYLAPNTNTAGVRSITTSASIAGTGALNVVNQDNTTLSAADGRGLLTLAGTNTYTGGTIIGAPTAVIGTSLSDLVTLSVNTGSTVGTGGTVSVLTSGALTLNGTANLGRTQTLSLSASLNGQNLINLNFTGTDMVTAISFDGGSTFAAPGTYGAAGSGATNTTEAGFFTGTGTITVVPEPSTDLSVALLAAGGLAGYMVRRRASLKHQA